MKFFNCLLLLFIALNSYGQGNAIHNVRVASSEFDLYGKTNINTFHCRLIQDYSADQIKVESYRDSLQIVFDGLTFTYRVENFDCGIGAMNRDLQNTLKSKYYPNLKLTVKEIILDPENTEIEELEVSANVVITIAGVKREVFLEKGKIINYDDDQLSFFGEKALKMTDFEIDPPSKMLGAIKVRDELNIAFHIKMITDLIK